MNENQAMTAGGLMARAISPYSKDSVSEDLHAFEQLAGGEEG